MRKSRFTEEQMVKIASRGPGQGAAGGGWPGEARWFYGRCTRGVNASGRWIVLDAKRPEGLETENGH